MKNLPILIKLRQRELDNLRRNMSVLEEELAQLQAEEKKLKAQLQYEKKIASQNPHIAMFYGNFAQGNKQQQQQLKNLQQELDQKIANIQDEISDAFGELKKFEITQENILQREEEYRQQQEQKELDDIGLQQYRRLQEEAQDD